MRDGKRREVARAGVDLARRIRRVTVSGFLPGVVGVARSSNASDRGWFLFASQISRRRASRGARHRGSEGREVSAELEMAEDVYGQDESERAERCGNCRWWQQSRIDPEIGACRRYPPTLNHAAMVALVWSKYKENGNNQFANSLLFEKAWQPSRPEFASAPETYNDDFCGEFTPRPANPPLRSPSPAAHPIDPS